MTTFNTARLNWALALTEYAMFSNVEEIAEGRWSVKARIAGDNDIDIHFIWCEESNELTCEAFFDLDDNRRILVDLFNSHWAQASKFLLGYEERYNGRNTAWTLMARKTYTVYTRSHDMILNEECMDIIDELAKDLTILDLFITSREDERQNPYVLMKRVIRYMDNLLTNEVVEEIKDENEQKTFRITIANDEEDDSE